MKTAHIHMRKLVFAAASVILLIALSLGACALTDASSIGFELSVDPTTLKAPGAVTVKATVTNKGTEDITVPMTLYDADEKIVTAAFDGGVLSLLKAGESAAYTGKWNVSQKHLDAGKFSFNLRLNTTDATGAIAQVSVPASASIVFQGEKVDLSVTRTITPEVIRSGDTVKVTYELVNGGTVKLNNILIKENSLISTKTQNVKTLEAGKSARLTFEKKAGNAGLESSAVITYYREGSKSQLRDTLETVKIPIAKPGFSATLSADKTSVNVGEKVTLTLTMKNEGNISYKNIKVTDARLGEVFTGLTLDAGETVTQTKEITMNVPTAFRFSIALSDNTGVTQTQTTNELKISAYAEGQMMRLNAQLSADREAVDSLPGLVRMSITITNDSNAKATPVNVYHGGQQIASIGELAPGQTVNVTREFNISQAGKFRFEIRTVDVLNNTVSFDTNEISVAYNPPTPAPTKAVQATVPPVVTYSPIPAGGDDSVLSKGKNALFILTWAVGLLLAAALGLFLVSSLLRAKARKQSETAYDHLDTLPKRDYADPETYQGDEEGSEKDEQAAGERPAVANAVKEEDLPHHKYLKEESTLKASQETDEPEPRPEAEAGVDERQTADEGGYRLVREGVEEATDAPVAQRRPRRRAARNRQLPEDDE